MLVTKLSSMIQGQSCLPRVPAGRVSCNSGYSKGSFQCWWLTKKTGMSVTALAFEKKLGIEGKEERFNVGYFFLQESKLGHRINKDS